MTSNYHSQNQNEKVHVNSYTKKDGTDVSSHERRRPNSGLPMPDKNYSDNFASIDDIKRGFQQIHDFFQVDEYNRNVGDKIQDAVYVDTFGKIRDKEGKAMTEFLYNAVNDFEYAKQDKNAQVFDSANSIPNANLRKFITTDDNITNNGTIDVKSMKGAYYNSSSNVAKSISKEENLRKYINQNKEELIKYGNIINENDKKVPKGGEIYFENEKVATKTIYLDGFANRADIANCTLYNPHIDKNGHFKAQLIDIVDYKPMDYSNALLKDKLLQLPNEWGVKMQESGRIKKVFHIVDIDIPVEN